MYLKNMALGGKQKQNVFNTMSFNKQMRANRANARMNAPFPPP